MIRHMVACDNHRGIAKNGVQPWKLPTDEQYFTDMTKKFGGVVLMGRTTFEVIGQPLSDRQNFVLTRDHTYNAEGVEIVHDLNAFLDDHPEVWVIGGAEIFAQSLRRADELYVTQIDADYDCDKFYPDFSRHFTLNRSEPKAIENGLTYQFCVYAPKSL